MSTIERKCRVCFFLYFADSAKSSENQTLKKIISNNKKPKIKFSKKKVILSLFQFMSFFF